MSRIVDYTGADVFEMVAQRGYPVPDDPDTAIGVLLLSEGDDVVLSVPDGPDAESRRIEAAEAFLANAPEPEADDDDDYEHEDEADDEVVALGNGWYQVGDDKYHGRAALEAAGYEVP